MKFKLSEIGDIVTGATPKKSLKNAFGTFIPFLTPVDYKNSRTSNVTIRGLSEVGLNALKTRQLSANSISVTSIGSDMGKTQFNEKPLVTNQQINSIHNIKSEFSPLYVYYKLLSLHDYIYHIGSGNGSTMPILNKSDFSNIEIEVPEKSVQESIVSVLDPIDSWIETATVINDNLVELAIAMFKEMFPHIQYGDNQIGDYITPKRGKNLTSKNAVIGKIPVIAGGLSPATWHNQANTKKPVITISASGANAGFVNLWTIPV